MLIFKVRVIKFQINYLRKGLWVAGFRQLGIGNFFHSEIPYDLQSLI